MKRLLVLWLLVLAVQISAYAQESHRESLKGLPGFYVVVEEIDDKTAESESVDADQIHTDVELRLRKARIKVLSKAEWLASERAPVLYVNLNLVELKDSLFAFCMRVEVKQSVRLRDRESTDQLAITWDKSRAGAVGKARLKSLREDILDAVDVLLNDYLAANSGSLRQSSQ